MKRLTVYTKHRKINFKDTINSIKDSSGLMLMFSLFTCGLLLGGTVIFPDSSLQNTISNYTINTSFAVLLPVLLFFLVFSAGLSCLGIPVCCLTVFALGYYYGYSFTLMILQNGIEAYGNFLLHHLISSVITVLPIIFISDFALQTCVCLSASVIKKTERNTVDVKFYIMKSAAWFIILLLGIFIGYITSE